MNSNKKIIWIGIEGIAGAGKSTQLELLKSILPNKYPNYKIHFENEFSEDRIGKFLNSNIGVDDFRVKINNDIIPHLLVIADRLAQLRKILNKKENNLVILDRFILSDIAHALTSGYVELESPLYYIVKEAFDYIYNDLSLLNLNQHSLNHLFLDCSLDLALSRIEKRKRLKVNDIHKEYLSRLYITYKHLFKFESNSFQINANENPSKVHLDILKAIDIMITK